MRITRLMRASLRGVKSAKASRGKNKPRKSTIPPAKWQEFIEI